MIVLNKQPKEMKSQLGVNRPLSGQLQKYTNVVKGWQPRWFTVHAETGTLSYYLCDGEAAQPSQTPRGEVISKLFINNVFLDKYSIM